MDEVEHGRAVSVLVPGEEHYNPIGGVHGGVYATISTLPGMGPKLGAEFLAATGGDMDAFGTADRLAGFAGLAPQPPASRSR